MPFPKCFSLKGLGRGLAALGLVLLVLAVGPRFAMAQSVTDRFVKAQRLFNQGKIKQAYPILLANVRKYPAHQPSRLLLARVLFRTGNVKQAAGQFKRASVSMLYGDVAYEYGVTFFQLNDCRRAKAGFGKVGVGSKLESLASFYNGLCLLQGREYFKAQKYLARAKALPPVLEKKRREALNVARRQLRNDSRGGTFAAQNPYVIAATPLPPPAYPSYAEPPRAATSSSPPVETPKKPPPPASGATHAVTPSLTLTQKAISLDFFGTAADESEVFQSDMKVAFKSRYSAEPHDDGGQPYASLGGDFGQFAENVRGSKVEYRAYQDRPGEIIEAETERPPVTASSAVVNLNPEAGYPLTSSIDLTGGYKYKDKLPDMKAEGKINEAGPYGAALVSGETLSLKLTANQLVTDDAAAKFAKTVMVFGAELDKTFDTTSIGLALARSETSFARATPLPPGRGKLDTVDSLVTVVTGDLTKNWDTFSVTLSGSFKTIENPFPQVHTLAGEAGSIKTEVSGTRTFEFGGSLTMLGASEQLTDFQDVVNDVSKPKDDQGAYPKVVVKGNGSRTQWSVAFKLTPFDWMFGSASYKEVRLNVAPSDSTHLLEMQKQNAEIATEFVLQAGLSKTL